MEATNLLYQCNTFDFRQSEGLIRLPQLLPDRFQRIRRIRFSTAFQCPIHTEDPPRRQQVSRHVPDDPSQWPTACDLLASMKTLEELHITLAIWPQNLEQVADVDADSIQALLRPLGKVQAARLEVVLTTNVPDEVIARLGTQPFCLTKREKPGIGLYTTVDDD